MMAASGIVKNYKVSQILRGLIPKFASSKAKSLRYAHGVH